MRILKSRKRFSDVWHRGFDVETWQTTVKHIFNKPKVGQNILNEFKVWIQGNIYIYSQILFISSQTGLWFCLFFSAIETLLKVWGTTGANLKHRSMFIETS